METRMSSAVMYETDINVEVTREIGLTRENINLLEDRGTALYILRVFVGVGYASGGQRYGIAHSVCVCRSGVWCLRCVGM